MNRPICPPDESVVRAICAPDHYDPIESRISPSLFKENTSVSRLKVIPLEDHWDLFRKKLETPFRHLELIGEIVVGHLQRIGREYMEGPPDKRKPRPTELTVEIAPERWNTAHAVIPQKITRGLGNAIVDALKKHRPPQNRRA